jgi:hypothetical protein
VPEGRDAPAGVGTCGRAVIDSARQQWEDGRRRLDAEVTDPLRYRQLYELVDAVVSELRRLLGQRFTVAELAALHADAPDWARPIVEDALPPEPRVGIRDVSIVVDAAFDTYARGATDYAP